MAAAPMVSLPTFPPFDIHADTNVGPRWTEWLARSDRLMTAMNISDQIRKRGLLLHYGGPDRDELFDTLTEAAATGTATVYSTATKALTDYFSPQENTAFEVYIPFARHPKKMGKI